MINIEDLKFIEMNIATNKNIRIGSRNMSKRKTNNVNCNDSINKNINVSD